MHWSAQGIPRDLEQRPIERRPNDKNTAPSVLLSRTVGEPRRLDYWSPPHPRGTAAPWPPEAAVNGDTGGGRFPIAAAWTGRVDDGNELWRWIIDDEDHELSSLDALASGASQLAKMHAKDAPSAIVIPNDFRQREQQKLLDACAAAGVNASLLWLPVAAALAWLEQQQDKLTPPRSVSDDPLTLPIVHADWGQVRCSTLQLVPTKAEKGFRWIPARKRPKESDCPIPGFGWGEAAACEASNSQAIWKQRFASPVQARSTNPSTSDSNLLEQIAGWSIEQKSNWQVDLTLAEHLKSIPSAAAIVFVGDFADQVASGEHVSRQTAAAGIPTLIADGVVGECLLARGSAIFALDRVEGRTSYLDTLPDLELFVDRNHQYDWLSLLGDTDQFVSGGEEWNLPRPIEGLALRRGATSIKLVVAHDEYDGVRELQVTLDRPAEQRLSATLRVSATPAQGNAKLRLLTQQQGEIPSRSIQANWDRMKPVLDHEGQSVDKETFLKMQPRAFPELFPRRWSHGKWRAAMPTVQKMIQRVSNELPEAIMKDDWAITHLKDRLLAKDQSQSPYDATAIGSDFKAPYDQNVLEALGESLLKLWRSTNHLNSPALSTLVRAMGYLSIEDSDFDLWLAINLQNSFRDRQSVLHTSGLAMRNPESIAALFDFVFFPNGRLASPGANELKAISQVLRYRTNATQGISSVKCEQVIQSCIGIFERGMERGGGGYPFRWASLIIVYMLRRRMFDLDFLDPEQELATQAKELFRTAIERHKQRRLRPMGGSVDLPAALQQMINYIDRKGSGDILMASE
ncbi:hypothetical protein FHS27_001276 [Rhodopirellula rubra]|uniref:Ig-like domain-containing protein n=1 Tax=Aporhodopirellula rubra TaxID=980271 RepID=A0A7W5H551_9BACT|nr:hypothetical protein [Aporhodopirellula rubra]MBB3205476.1 hypothetical protein [Aporhodopirellula rubra]